MELVAGITCDMAALGSANGAPELLADDLKEGLQADGFRPGESPVFVPRIPP